MSASLTDTVKRILAGQAIHVHGGSPLGRLPDHLNTLQQQIDQLSTRQQAFDEALAALRQEMMKKRGKK
jgi:hypothetical protein